MYRVDNIPKGGIGGNEFHRIRQEIIIPIRGRLVYECEDLFGQKDFDLTPETSIWIPPLVMHSYEALENDNATRRRQHSLRCVGQGDMGHLFIESILCFSKEFRKARKKKEINQWPTKMFKSLF